MPDPRLAFTQIANTGKTLKWNVFKGTVCLGMVGWYAPWRRYCFYPGSQLVFDRSCLMEIVEFIDARMAERTVEGARPATGVSA